MEIELGESYVALLEEIKHDVAHAQHRARRVLAGELVGLYWRIGRRILDRQETEGWGTRVIDRLAADLRAVFPDARGFSARNLQYMRSFADQQPDPAIAQQAAAQLPWSHWMVLLDKLGGHGDLQRWYANEAAEHGWSRPVLTHMVAGQLHARQGEAPSNFPATLAADDAEAAQEMTRDPYLLDFVGITGPLRERELEDELVRQLQRFLLELGTGFAFIGRQYPVRVDRKEYALDLLFFNWRLDCFVAIELQVGDFDPDHAGRLAFYTAWIDDQLRLEHHQPTIGILICTGKTNSVVRYTLQGIRTPMAVATYTTTLPDALQGALPAVEALEHLVDEQLHIDDRE